MAKNTESKDQDLIFFNFVAANRALLKCYARIPEDDVKSMSKQ